MFEDQQKRILESIDDAHAAYNRAALFSGPSVYFHHKSLVASRDRDMERFSECVYATLASWGMHRMGPGGSKMGEFQDFRHSLLDVWPTAMRLQKKTPENLTEADWSALNTIFCGIRCMASGTSLVGNSKVMAHMLPNLIPPVDRAYTLTFLFNHGRIKNGKASEWETLVQILKHFFYPIVHSTVFQTKVKGWLDPRNRSDWDTSELKIVDNLLIGLMKFDKEAIKATPQSRISKKSY